MRILVIGADDDRVAWVEWTLLDEDVDLCLTSRGEEGVAHAMSSPFELIILDPHLPDLSGPGILKRFAEGRVGAPVVIVSDQAGVEDMSRGFGFGADAYITVPHGDGTASTARKELIACIYSLTGGTRKPPLVIAAGGFTLEFNTRWLKINGERVCLGGSEFRIVELLGRRRGEIFSKEALCAYLGRLTDDPEHKVVDVFISRARKIMASHSAGHNFIETVWGKGYRFGEPKSATR